MLLKSEGSFVSAQSDSAREKTLSRAISSYYYACFQCTVALMLLRGVPVSKHTFVRSFVNKELILKGLLPGELGKFYNDLMDSRSDADYSFYTSRGRNDCQSSGTLYIRHTCYH